jgi:AcrR family transcriptional regulator
MADGTATGPPTRRGRATRSLLVEAAREVVAEKDYAEAKVTDTTSRAGVATGSFYGYFPSKEQLFREVAAEVIDELVAAAHPDPEAGKLRDQLAALQDKDREQQLARAKREVELKQKQLELAGLTATEADYAELKRLEQEATLLEKRRSVATASATSDEDAGKIARLTQQLELADTQRAARTEAELREVKDVLARLEVLAAVLEKLQDPDSDTDADTETD